MSFTNSILLAIAVLLLTMVIIQFLAYRLRRKEVTGGGNKYRSNAASAIRDVLIASMTKGQLPIAILGVIGIIIFIRVPSETILTVLAHLPRILKSLGGLGWILLLVVSLFSIASVHKLKTLNTREKSAFGKERNNYLEIINELNATIKKLNESFQNKK